MKFPKIRITKKRLIIAAVIIMVGGFGYFKTRPKPVVLKFVSVNRDTIRQTLIVSGSVEAKETVQLHFLTSGKVAALNVKEGDLVTKGQTLVALDVADLKKNLQKDLNDYLTARTNFDQQNDDAKQTLWTDTIKRLVNKQQYSLDNTVLDVELSDIALKNSYLVAPIGGIVTSIPVMTTGVQITATQNFEIVNPATLLFSAEVDEVDIGLIKKGLPATIFLDAYNNGETLSGMLEYLAFKSQTSTRTSGATIFKIEIPLPGVDVNRYRLGMNGTADIELAKHENALVVPLEAVEYEEDQAFVRVKTTKEPEKRNVTTGIESETHVEIQSGLTEGEEVVTAE